MQTLTKRNEKQENIGLLEKTVHGLQEEFYGKSYIGAALNKVNFGEDANQKIKKFLESKENFLVFFGNSGIGKTYFSAALTEYLLMNFPTFCYWTESNFFRRVQYLMDVYKDEYKTFLKLQVNENFMCLDNVGSTKCTDWKNEILLDVIDYRQSLKMPTIFLSDLSMKQFKEIYSPDICSKLFASENIIIELMDGQDLRNHGK